MVNDNGQGILRPAAQAATLAYAAAAAVFCWKSRATLFSTIHTYHPSFTWSLRDMTVERVNALVDAGDPILAASYNYLCFFSLVFVLSMLIAGIVSPFIARGRSETDPVVLTIMTVLSLVLIAAFACGPSFADRLWQARAVPFNLANVPFFWIGSMISGSLLTGWTLALFLDARITSFVGPRSSIARPVTRRI